MPTKGWSPAVVPYGADETAYLVVDSFGAFGSVYREAEIELRWEWLPSTH